MFNEKPIVAAVHPNLIEELKERKRAIEEETGRKTKGGLTCFSEMAALELRTLRLSGKELMEKISKLKTPPIKKIVENGTETEYVPYEFFKKLYILSSVLNKKKDRNSFIIDVSKVKGLKKNEIQYFWR